MMKYKIYLDELAEKSDELIKYSKTNIKEKIDELSIVFDDVNWYGKASSTYIKGYNEKIKRLRRINDNLELLANFLKNGYSNYNEVHSSLRKSWEEIVDEKRGDEDVGM